MSDRIANPHYRAAAEHRGIRFFMRLAAHPFSVEVSESVWGAKFPRNGITEIVRRLNLILVKRIL
jgi:hypothetical protein